MRVKLLGEELIGYRTTSGAVGLIQNACPHRGASLFFGRNEEEGLRCVYHGWKFDVTGACVDMPSEPAESNFRNKVRAKAYPTHERGGIVWTYMGPREVPPPLPDMEANIMIDDPEQISILQRRCNWMQGLEGELDTVHAAFLHWRRHRLQDDCRRRASPGTTTRSAPTPASSPKTRTSVPPTAPGDRRRPTPTTGASATRSSPSSPCRPRARWVPTSR